MFKQNLSFNRLDYYKTRIDITLQKFNKNEKNIFSNVGSVYDDSVFNCTTKI